MTGVPAWLAIEDWRALIIASYTDAYNPTGADVYANRKYGEEFPY